MNKQHVSIGPCSIFTYLFIHDSVCQLGITYLGYIANEEVLKRAGSTIDYKR